MFKTPSGTELISKALESFKQVQAKLEQGIDECRESIKITDATIAALEKQKTEDSEAITKASAVITNITTFLGETK